MHEFLHVDDLADAVVFLFENYDGHQPINCGAAVDLSICDLAERSDALLVSKASSFSIFRNSTGHRESQCIRAGSPRSAGNRGSASMKLCGHLPPAPDDADTAQRTRLGCLCARGLSHQMGETAQKSLDILIYGLNYAPEPIGVGRYTGDIGSFLGTNGHRVRVVTAPPHYPGWVVKEPYRALSYMSEMLDGLSVVRCPIFLKREMRGIWRLLTPLSFAVSSAPIVLWSLLRHRPDVVLCVEPTLFAAPVALAVAKCIGARTILHVQDLEIDSAFAVGHLKSGFAQQFAYFFERRVLQSFDQIISISNKMRERLVSKGVKPERLALIRNWVDLDQIRPLIGGKRFREELGLSEETFVILYSGNIGAKQALHVVLDAAERLVDDTRLAFVLVGEGPEKPQLMARYGHLPNVYFLPLQPEEHLCELLNFADLQVLPQAKGVADLVLPSKLGGMLASGKPVLVTADEGTELFELLYGTAIIVPTGDSEAMAREIQRLAREGFHPALGDGRLLAEIFSRQKSLQDLQMNLVLPNAR